MDIATRSDIYGNNFCRENAAALMAILREHVIAASADSSPKLEVRVYDSVDNKLIMVPLHDVLASVPMDAETGMPEKLRSTRAGQVALTPRVHLSRVVYHVIQGMWALLKSEK